MARSELGRNDLPPDGILSSTPFVLSSAAQRGVREVEQSLAPLGIRSRHYGVLALLQETGPQPQTALSERLRIDRTTMVALIDDLEERGLVSRRTDPSDRRAYRVILTAGGEQLLTEATLAVSDAEATLLAPLSPKQRKRFQSYLLQIAGIEAPDEE